MMNPPSNAPTASVARSIPSSSSKRSSCPSLSHRMTVAGGFATIWRSRLRSRSTCSGGASGGGVLVHHQNRIRGQQIEKVGTGWGGRVRCGAGLGTDWENRYPVDRVAGALRIEIETAHRHDLIAPPLDARRRRHSKAVDVENAAAYGVLRDFCDRRYALVTHRVQSFDCGCEAAFFFRRLEDQTGVL